MVRLASVRGGETVYIPAQLPEHHWLIEAVGLDLAKKLCEHFALTTAGSTKQDGANRKAKAQGRARLYLPVLPIEIRVKELTEKKTSTNQIARMLQISQRSVFRYKKNLREAGLL